MDSLVVRVLFGLLLLVIPLYLFYAIELKRLNTFIVSVVRMVVQLALVGMYMYWLFDQNNVWLNLLWLLLMSGVTTGMVIRQARLNYKAAFLPLFVSIFVSTLAISLYIIKLVMNIDEVFISRWFIPVNALFLSLSAETIGLVLREYYIGLVRFREHYYYKVGNGATWIQAIAPILRRALDRGYLAVSHQLSLTGLVVFPGVLLGLLMMAVDPWYAVVTTVVLLVATLAFQVLAILLSVFLTHRVVTTVRGQLTDIISKKHLLHF